MAYEFRTYGIDELATRWNFSEAKILDLMLRDPTFPLPIKKTRGRPHWAGAEVFNWEKARLKRKGGSRAN